MTRNEYKRIEDKLAKYYVEVAPKSAEKLQKECFAALDLYDSENPGLVSYSLKAAQYEKISERIEPVIFPEVPYYFETGALHPYCDGQFYRGMLHANGWLNIRNNHIFGEEDPERHKVFSCNVRDKLYLSGYVDTEHFRISNKKVFEKGLSGVYSEAEEALAKCENDEERSFVQSAMRGLLCLKRLAEKFSEKASKLLAEETDGEREANLRLIADTASRVPWNKPESVYESLATLAFMRKAVGSLEGVGFNSFGRVDLTFAPLYKSDIEKGVSPEQLYDLIAKFLLIWDAHVDKSKIMSGYADYEYENAMQLGGCDIEHNEVFNDMTRMILHAHDELDLMYPKIKCRYSSKSSKEYLELIGKPVLNQKSILLYCNDDAMLPALAKQGFPWEIAYNYAVSGCWGIGFDDYYNEACGYLNTLRAVEWGMFMPEDKLRENKLDFISLESCGSFEEVYSAVLHNILEMIHKKADMESVGARNWSKVSPTCIYSALITDPLQTRKDYTAGGASINWEQFNLAALPDTIDSLLAIKNLCFDKKLCTIRELSDACRDNWSNEALWAAATHSPAHGDGSEESARLLARIVDDIYNNTRELPTSYGGTWQISSYMYTEIIWWGKEMLATPNGRRNGEYLSQGLTPSRLHTIKSVSDVLMGLRYYDYAKLSCGSVINVILPVAKLTKEIMTDFLRACARTKTHIMQINCVNRDDLLKAQEKPEDYKNIIVRVCGFSAPFVSLSKEFQKEFLSRIYYEE